MSLPGAAEELDRFRAAGIVDDDPLTLEALVASRSAPPDVATVGVAEAVDVRVDRTIPLAGRELGVRMYRHGKAGPRPLLLWLHGGGFVGGSLDDIDVVCAGLARRASVVVVSLDYRLAPEDPFPAGLDDAVETIAWLRTHGEAFGGDGRLAAGGQSAGATLVAGACLLARDRGLPSVDRQVLCYPWLDLTSPDDEEDPISGWYRSLYLGGRAPSRYAGPLLASDLSALPPALLVIAGQDRLRDDALRYAQRLSECAVRVDVIEYVGAPHAFLQFPASFSLATRAYDDIAADLDDSFGHPSTAR